MIHETNKAAAVKFPNAVVHKHIWNCRHYETQLAFSKVKTLPEKETKREVVMSTFTLEVHCLRLQSVLSERPEKLTGNTELKYGRRKFPRFRPAQ